MDNISSTGYSQYGWAAWPAVQYVPLYGKEGILLVLGGDAPKNQTYTEAASLRDMYNVTIYDIYGQIWYHQTATGDVPERRLHTCIVGAQSDNDTYEM